MHCPKIFNLLLAGVFFAAAAESAIADNFSLQIGYPWIDVSEDANNWYKQHSNIVPQHLPYEVYARKMTEPSCSISVSAVPFPAENVKMMEVMMSDLEAFEKMNKMQEQQLPFKQTSSNYRNLSTYTGKCVSMDSEFYPNGEHVMGTIYGCILDGQMYQIKMISNEANSACVAEGRELADKLMYKGRPLFVNKN